VVNLWSPFPTAESRGAGCNKISDAIASGPEPAMAEIRRLGPAVLSEKKETAAPEGAAVESLLEAIYE